MAAAPHSPALPQRRRAEQAAARLPPLLAAAERVAATVAQGAHGRRRSGRGDAFWQFRRYRPGDAPSLVDWRQSARADAVFVRENEWEAMQSLWLWRDASGSMNYRSAAELPTKRDRAEVLLLALAILLTRGGERVALLGGERPPAGGHAAVERITLDLLAAAGVTDDRPPPAGSPLPRFCQPVLLGDFLVPLEEVDRQLRDFSNRGLRGHLLQILDPAEETLPFSGRVHLSGLEGETPLLAPRIEGLRDAYRRRLQDHRAGLAAIARNLGWSFAVHHTDRPPETALLALWSAVARQPVAGPDDRS